MSGEVLDQDLKEKAYSACKDFLGGRWKEISISEFKLSEIRGGLSNKLYLCSLPKNTAKEPQVPEKVLLRIYGPILDDPNLLVSGAVIFLLLSERRLGPKLYGLLPEGRLEEFIPSHSLCIDEMRLYSPLIARELAKIHALDVPLKKTPDLFQVFMAKWLKEAEDVIQKDNEYFMPLNEYRKELEWFPREMAKINSPVVFCHNDLQGGNILFREDVTQNEIANLMIIDFEFAGYNYRGFDVALHFCESCFEYDTPEYPHYRQDIDNFPTRQQQIEFFTIYLDQLSKEGVLLERPLKDEIDSMLNEISLFASAACLLITVWCAKMVAISRDHGFGHREHAKLRTELYKKFKEQYLASLSDNSSNKF